MSKMPISCFFILLTLACLAACEDWFMPNSHLISDGEFRQKVLNDTSTYKIVKFFTPNCVYCRYLKNTIDELKQQRQWSFQIYDFNCAWYANFCNSEIQAQAFPYTAVYNDKGELQSSLIGFYPTEVILELFQQVEAANAEIASKSSRSLNQEAPKIINQQQGHNPQSQPPQQQTKDNMPVVKEETENKGERKQQNTHHEHPAQLQGAIQHIFFAICILLGVVYFSSFAHLAKEPSYTSKPNPEVASNASPKQQGKVHHFQQT